MAVRVCQAGRVCGFRCAAVRAVAALALLLVPMVVESRSSGHGVRGKKAAAAAAVAQSGCELFHYFDGGTDMCEHCRDLCDHAKIWGTEEECQRECSDYLTSLQCRRPRRDEYYDEQTRTCSPCRDLCQYHLIRRTTRQCRTYCPDYQFPKKDEENQNNNNHHPVLHTAAPATPLSPVLEEVEEENKDPQKRLNNVPASSPAHRYLIWVIPCVSILIIVTAVAVVFLISKRRHNHSLVVKYQPASVTDESLHSCQPVAPPLTHPQMETQPGIFSELVCA